MMIKNLTLALATTVLLAACGVKSPQRQAPPEKFSEVTAEVTQEAVLPDPKVNIIFVVDNSGSMKGYQAKMAANIQLFAETFFENSRVDYRIGVVPVYDSKYLNDKTVYVPSGVRKMNALGELVTLKGADGKNIPDQLFITRDTPNPKEVLKNTVMIGTQWGPEAEESFSPVLAVTDLKTNLEKNKGFYQTDAYLAVIFLTDADDVTPGLSAEDFYQQLVDLKGGDRSKVLIAAALPNRDNNSASCAKDGRGPVQAFPSLLSVSGGIFADLCSRDFGSHLAEFGHNLVQRVAAQKRQLDYTPDITTLKVCFSKAKTCQSTVSTADEQILERPRDYAFNPETNEIVLSPYLKLQRIEGASLRISAKPVSLGNYKSDRVTPINRVIR
ncbi:MAG: hypothetical protein B7Y39_06295 [Bdellovibrio sp. 28-41-41]|nr:MAG: hypothetical protein B7Y39_06295 [Bdellovibrio sp. 28-41-41]